MTDQPSQEELSGIGSSALALVVLMQQSNNAQLGHVYGTLVKGMQEDLDRTYAETAAIRSAIEILCSLPWAPSQLDLLDILYPESRKEVLARIRQYIPGEGARDGLE
jgi:hypothetical protein